MAGIIGKKLEMTRVIHNGKFVPVTLIKVPTLTVAQVKTVEKDGYEAVVIRMVDGKKETFREVPYTGSFVGLEKDVEITLDMLDGVAEFTVTSTSKGKGYAGAMKRWNFGGLTNGHGHKYTRSLGSIGTRKPRRTKLGKKMHGHLGLDTITLKHIPLVLVNKDLRVIGVKGPIAGSRHSLITLTF